MKYDDILKIVGEFGPYQKFQYFLLCLAVVVSALHGFNMVFTGATPEHHCKQSLKGYLDLPNNNASENFSDEWLQNISMPTMKNIEDVISQRSQCFAVNTSALFAEDDTIAYLPCTNGWVYDQTYYHSTIVTKWDLVCDKAWIRQLADMTFFGGRLVGALFFGKFADRYGRQKSFLLAFLLLVVSGCGAALVPWVWLYLVLFCIQGVAQCGIFILSFVMCTEIVGPSKRKIGGLIHKYSYSLGQLILVCIAYFTRNWTQIALSISLPGIFFITFYWILPESSRWLYMKGKKEEARVILQKTAMHNKLCVHKSVFQKFEDVSESNGTGSKDSVTRMFTSLPNAKVCLSVWFLLFFSNSIIIGLTLNTKNLGGDPYANFFYSALVELPAITLVAFLVDRIGRRPCLFLGLLSASITCFPAGFLPEDYGWLKLLFFLMGKFGITMPMTIIFLVSAEIFPTTVRSQAVGFGACFGHIGSVLAPVINGLGGTYRPAPFIIFSVFSALGCVLVLFLPETLGKDMPQTMDDYETLIRSQNNKNQIDNCETGIVNHALTVSSLKLETQNSISNIQLVNLAG